MVQEVEGKRLELEREKVQIDSGIQNLETQIATLMAQAPINFLASDTQLPPATTTASTNTPRTEYQNLSIVKRYLEKSSHNLTLRGRQLKQASKGVMEWYVDLEHDRAQLNIDARELNNQVRISGSRKAQSHQRQTKFRDQIKQLQDINAMGTRDWFDLIELLSGENQTQEKFQVCQDMDLNLANTASILRMSDSNPFKSNSALMRARHWNYQTHRSTRCFLKMTRPFLNLGGFIININKP